MVAALCEEVHNPQKEVPKAMVWSVVAAGITGVVYLLPIIFVLPVDRIDDLLAVASLQPMPELYKIVTRSAEGAMCLLVLSMSLSPLSGHRILLCPILGANSSPRHLVLRNSRLPDSRIALHLGLLSRRRHSLLALVEGCEPALQCAPQLAHSLDGRLRPLRAYLPRLLGRV